MRKINIFLCAALVIVSFFGCHISEKQKEYELSITATEISNNSVGEDWKKTYECDGISIQNGERYALELGGSQKTIAITIVEKDLYPDVGYGCANIVLEDGFSTSVTISVVENAGRYAYNEALWKITFSVSLRK